MRTQKNLITLGSFGQRCIRSYIVDKTAIASIRTFLLDEVTLKNSFKVTLFLASNPFKGPCMQGARREDPRSVSYFYLKRVTIQGRMNENNRHTRPSY